MHNSVPRYVASYTGDDELDLGLAEDLGHRHGTGSLV